MFSMSSTSSSCGVMYTLYAARFLATELPCVSSKRPRVAGKRTCFSMLWRASSAQTV
jgi:hypothetical protein